MTVPGTRSRWLRGTRSPGARTLLVCFPHAGGAAGFFHDWAALTPPWLDVLAVQYPGRQDRLNDPCPATLEELADLAAIFFLPPKPPPEALAKHLTEAARAGVALLAGRLGDCDWNKEAIAACLKSVLAEAGLKMPHLAVPVRLLVFGREQTPSVDAMLAQMPRETVIARLTEGAART